MCPPIHSQNVVVKTATRHQKQFAHQIYKRVQHRPKVEWRRLKAKIEATQNEIENPTLAILSRRPPYRGYSILGRRRRYADPIGRCNVVGADP